MYVITFYSFKGGVGRTLALVNVATELARRGRRVLVVDFDLEAPGLPSFKPLASAADNLGIVDFVAQYQASHEAPPIRPYLARARMPPVVTGELWIMSAGRQDPGYPNKLHSIDWLHLYSAEQGFLLFEDLRAQWAATIAPDYVLIDSRTGFTDVGGICTRQLPDAVVMLFVPNEQNIAGLAQQARAIRGEASSPRRRKIALHFVPSNVPDLDDEDGVLESLLATSCQRLEYDEPTVTIHHYDAIEILDQAVFVLERPKSRLARAYSALTDELVAGNLDDREGAIKFLDQVLRARRRGGRHLEDETGRLEQVGRAHKQDGDVLFKLAMVAERDGDSRTALDLLGRAARAGYQGADLLLRRGVISLGLGNEKDAIEDLKQVLLSRRAEPPDLLGAVGILLERRPDVVVALADNLAAAAAGDESTRIILAERLLSSYLTAPVAERISRGDGSDLHAPASLSLALIAQQKFAEAMSVIGESEDAVLERDDLRDLFNYAMAAWGEKGRPPEKIFRRVLELTASTQDGGANMHQCVALAAAATGEPSRAREELAKSRAAVSGRRDVSCWRYLEVPSIEFQRDLDSIERMLDDPSVIPEIFRPRPTSAAQPELPLPK